MGRRNRRKNVDGIQLSGIADKGRAVGRDEKGQVYFLEGGVPGDEVNAIILRKKKGVPFGVVKEITKASPDRIEPFCKHFELCGGCKWQHLSYEKQLFHKELQVKNAIQRIARIEAHQWEDVLSCNQTKHYRNKLEYSFSSARWMTEEEIESGKEIADKKGLGFNKSGTFDKVIDLEECYLQPEPSNEIRNWLRSYTKGNGFEYYNSRSRKGWLRNIMLRNNRDGEFMVLLSVAYKNEKQLFPLLDAMKDAFPAISSIYYVVSDKLNSITIDLPYHHFFGKEVLEERLGNVQFHIGPKSFFQTNTLQAEKLYDVVKEYAAFDGSENVYDLYTGLGSIALYVADSVHSITGIEEIKEAIYYAEQNKELNKIHNAKFYAGDCKDILTDEFIKKHGKADVIITDPPRVGMHKEVVETILRAEPKKIVYVSCNPATQARDINLLSEKYVVEKIRAVDMFPHTHHVETVALLTRILTK